jgi:hypothetical protein
MKYMVDVRLKPGEKNNLMESFEKLGPNRNPGVKFHGAWIGAHSDVIFVLGESESESLVEQACRAWNANGDFQIHAVIDVENF